jgi:5-methylthioadenosine/S-adenosylhomocysteine deaminase
LNLAIVNARILPIEQSFRILKDATILIEDDAIVDIGSSNTIPIPRGTHRIDGSSKIVLPGLINTHSHSAMTLLRGYADDMKLDEWLNNWIWPIEAKMTAKDIHIGAKLAAAESALAGSTAITSMYWHILAEGKAIAEVGIRGMLGSPCVSWRSKESIQEAKEAARELHGKYDGLLRVAMMPHSPYTVDPELMITMRELANELNKIYGSPDCPVIMHTHVAETQDDWRNAVNQAEQWEKEGIDTHAIRESSSPVEYLDKLGMFTNAETCIGDFLAAHCVWLSKKDIEIIRDRSVHVVHNPESNLKLGSGIGSFADLKSAGVSISLGTDGACSNNTLNMFNAIRMAALIHKGYNLDPTLFPASYVMQLATINGAKALLWNQIGSLAVGKKADLITVDLRKPHLSPLHNEISHLVYAAHGSDVSETIVNGKLIVENQKILTINIEELLDEAEKAKDNLLQRLKDSKE